MPASDPNAADSQTWMSRSQGHLALARQPKPPGGFWEDLAFHAQQAAEFAIKAVYVHRGIVFRFTHDLSEFGTGLEVHGIDVPPSVRDAVILTRFAVHARYPGAELAVTE